MLFRLLPAIGLINHAYYQEDSASQGNSLIDFQNVERSINLFVPASTRKYMYPMNTVSRKVYVAYDVGPLTPLGLLRS